MTSRSSRVDETRKCEKVVPSTIYKYKTKDDLACIDQIMSVVRTTSPVFHMFGRRTFSTAGLTV